MQLHTYANTNMMAAAASRPRGSRPRRPSPAHRAKRRRQRRTDGARGPSRAADPPTATRGCRAAPERSGAARGSRVLAAAAAARFALCPAHTLDVRGPALCLSAALAQQIDPHRTQEARTPRPEVALECQANLPARRVVQ